MNDELSIMNYELCLGHFEMDFLNLVKEASIKVKDPIKALGKRENLKVLALNYHSCFQYFL
ncbi:MAG: hypothetical protein BWY48_00326 [Parcubacteria group bacterium ADurb.Bin305]|nr:MAG: hypothetical protein BWY48_00326 [Parcubacteria group bacterium ADurb.Bin305]